MSAIRDKARNVLDLYLPASKIITSDGATAKTYQTMSGGITHQMLLNNWANGGQLTCCNGFVGWYGSQLGSKTYLGGFDLKGIVTKAGNPEAWVDSTSDNWPRYGDILRHTAFHVDVALDFDDDVLVRAAGGQGGKSAGHDIIRRVRGTGPYDPKKIMGWISIATYFGEDDADDDDC